MDILDQKYAIIKNPQFLPNFFETWLKRSSHGLVILTKFHYDWVKIVDFFIYGPNAIFASRYCSTQIGMYITHLKKW